MRNQFDLGGFLFFMVVFLLGALIICQPKFEGVNWRNYERIELGMDLREVSELLGSGAAVDEADANRTVLRWEDDEIEISVVFINKEVVDKRMWVNGLEKK